MRVRVNDFVLSENPQPHLSKRVSYRTRSGTVLLVFSQVPGAESEV